MRKYLKDLRESHGFSMQDLADKLGISRQYYQMIENGERQKKMDITLVKSIASVFGLSLEEVCDFESALCEASE